MGRWPLISGHFFNVDATDTAQVGAAPKGVRDKFGALHVVVNCAVIRMAAKTVSQGVSHNNAFFSKVIALNVDRFFNCASQAAALTVS